MWWEQLSAGRCRGPARTRAPLAALAAHFTHVTVTEARLKTEVVGRTTIELLSDEFLAGSRVGNLFCLQKSMSHVCLLLFFVLVLFFCLFLFWFLNLGSRCPQKVQHLHPSIHRYLTSEHSVRTQKQKAHMLKRKGYLLLHARSQTFTEPWGENELQIKMSIWCIILMGRMKKGKCGVPPSFSLRGQTWGVVITNLALHDGPVGRLSAVLTGVFAG